MGAYINPHNETKEEFLKQHGTPCSENIAWQGIPEGEYMVVLVDNGPFTAAVIAFDEDEYMYIQSVKPKDPRPRTYYTVKRELLLNVSNLSDFDRAV